ncbi:nonribosomal peptide synthetase 12, partial [Cristinia sonorae]
DLTTLADLSHEDILLFSRFGVGPRQHPPFECVHDAFSHHSTTQADMIAVEHCGDSITYGELARKANALATQLRAQGVLPQTRVCLLVQRSIPMVIGILAILMAGGAYVPLDGAIVTQSTLEHVIHDSGCILTLAGQEFIHRVTNTPVISLDEAITTIRRDEGAHVANLSSPGDSAYIIYTSGTTGKPKGVEVTHRNVTNLVCLPPGNVEMAPGRRVSQLMNIAFDMAAWEILGSMSNGCTLCIRGKSSKEWRAVMKTVDIVIATPSMLTPHDPADYPNIKAVATAGEPCPQRLADSWSRTVNFYNSCGPTEITIVNTMQLHTPGKPISIGSPTPNNNVYILDDYMKAVPIGHPGIMWAGGAGISRGYVNLPDKTSERYKPDVFVNDGSYMFNTGDLGRWCPDGTLDHLGRVDDQVKVKGFRVELDGVSATMETCPSVTVAVALLVDSELWGFVTPENVNVQDVISATKKVQPYYAVPTRFKTLSELPNTSNGKIDKRALRQLALEELAAEALSSSKAEEDKIVEEKIQPIRSEFYSQALYEGKILSEILPTVAVPPHVYRPDLHAIDEKLHRLSSPPSSSGSDSELESLTDPGTSWEGYENDVLPQKIHRKFLRNLRHQIFSLYRRLFGVVFVVNMAILISIFVKGGANAQELGLVVVANLLCATLMRQDYVINTFFTICCAVPTSWPLAIRRVCARVYHIGGLHSGCAISGVVWLCAFTGQATKELLNKEKTSAPTVAITYFILMLLVGMVIFAYPKTRSTHHDAFERTHRFLGWTATALVWAQVISLTNDYRLPEQSLGQALIHSPPFWLVVVMTSSIILPWLRLRKVPVHAEVLSSHAVRLYFNYVTPKPGHFIRISESPLVEWHGFAAVPEPGTKGYSLVVSKAGDWTSKQIMQPPTHLWVRGVPCYGVLKITTLFRRVIFVATGSGIGPCAPVILARKVPIRLLWTSPNVRQTFGDKLVDSILDASPDAVIYDTRVHGKPDMVKLTYRLVREFNAEAVCIISNQKLTQKVVYGMMSRGIPAFGAIWDS